MAGKKGKHKGGYISGTRWWASGPIIYGGSTIATTTSWTINWNDSYAFLNRTELNSTLKELRKLTTEYPPDVLRMNFLLDEMDKLINA